MAASRTRRNAHPSVSPFAGFLPAPCEPAMLKGASSMKTNETRMRRAIACCAAATIAIALIVACVAYGPELFAFFADGSRLQAWVDDRGIFAPLAMAALIVFQIVVAVLPGEPLELGAGYAFGFWEGTVLCLAAGLVGTLIVVALVRTLGMKAVELFFSREKIASMKWLQDSARFELLMFVCFLIPGTPKDIMTYIAGLTNCPAWRIALITTVGRIPAIVSSTAMAGFAAAGDWTATAAVVALTAAFAVAGLAVYAMVVRREKKRESAAASSVGLALGERCDEDVRLAA